MYSTHRTLTPPQSNEPAHPPTLLLQRRIRPPPHGARILRRPRTRPRLVIEHSKTLELRIRQQPKVQHRRGEVRVHCASGQLDERAKREGHLLELVGEGWVARKERVGLDVGDMTGRGQAVSVGLGAQGAAGAAASAAEDGGGGGGGCGGVLGLLLLLGEFSTKHFWRFLQIH